LRHSNQALQPGNIGCTAGADAQIDAGQVVVLRLRKALRKFDLVGGKHIDRVVAAGLEHRQRRRMQAQAPQHQRRLERNRGEGIDGDADRLAVARAR
jgi:hypothetical protein